MTGTPRHEQIHLRIIELLKERLQKLGSIRTDDAWQICRNEFEYGVIAFHFKLIMQKMKEDGAADNVKNGVWFIHKNNFSEKASRL